MEISKAFKYRIYPNKEQRIVLKKQFGSVRFVYNHFLNRRIDHFTRIGKGLTYHDTAKELTLLKRHPDYVWLKEANSQSLQFALKSLDTAYNNFFQKRAKSPNFKKKCNKQSFKVPQHFAIEGNNLKLPKIGKLALVLHRPLEGKLVSATISKMASGKYFVSVQCEVDIEDPVCGGNIIGCDFGLKNFLTDSNGVTIKNPKVYKQSLKRITRLQRSVSRRKKGSTNRVKAVRRLAKKHEKINNQRNDFQHKLSYKMVVENQAIILEDLSLKNMIKNHCLAQALSDSGWAEFVRKLEYKGKWYGCDVTKIDRWFPSSKRCHKCNWTNSTLTLADRSWQCLQCHAIHDRDHNAAQNILIFGKAGHA